MIFSLGCGKNNLQSPSFDKLLSLTEGLKYGTATFSSGIFIYADKDV
jgi:hypothetical protein